MRPSARACCLLPPPVSPGAGVLLCYKFKIKDKELFKVKSL